jgi:hypothetical protein
MRLSIALYFFAGVISESRARGGASPLQDSAGASQHPDSRKSSATQDIDKKIVSQSELKQHETHYVAECDLPSTFGDFRMRAYSYESDVQHLEPAVMVRGDIGNGENVLVRVHDQCFTSEVFGSRRCDCREQLHDSLDRINEEGGVLIYLQQVMYKPLKPCPLKCLHCDYITILAFLFVYNCLISSSC